MMRKAVGFALILAGMAIAIAFASKRMTQPFTPVVALFLFLAGASLFGRVAGLAGKVSHLVGKTVKVKVWGSDLPGDKGSGFRLDKVSALGAGLHLYLRPLPDGASTHLKIAQPRGAVVGQSGVEVIEAKYIQWAGSKIKKPKDTDGDTQQPLPKAFLMGVDERGGA
jgi:hypothetical protein